MKGVFTLRNADDLKQIQEVANNAKNVVVLGGSFIGSECAGSIKFSKKDDVNVHLIFREDVLFQNTLGDKIGSMLSKWHESHGVNLLPQTNIKEFVGENGKITKVVLDNGKEIDADLVIVGFGVKPATNFIKDSGIEINKDGGVNVDVFMQTSHKDIFAAGDIAAYPYWSTGGRTRTEHWVVAQDQGSYAAWNMLGKLIPYGSIPFFWTRTYNQSL